MLHEYSAENHDWDLTLRAAFELFEVGRDMDQRPRTGNMSMGFSAFTGSMLLSFSAIESFSASVAFSMPQTDKFKAFDFEAYRRERTFWGKLNMLSPRQIRLSISQKACFKPFLICSVGEISSHMLRRIGSKRLKSKTPLPRLVRSTSPSTSRNIRVVLTFRRHLNFIRRRSTT